MRPDEDSSLGGKVVRVGISSCLLGERVRYNGEHREASLLVAELGSRVEWVSVCPELEVGMGVPREPVHLVIDARTRRDGRKTGQVGRKNHVRHTRLLGIESRRDLTAETASFAASCARRLEALGISGYIFKSKSPSCGLEGVQIHAADRAPQGEGRGLFAAAITAHFPGLPVAEETQLLDRAACRAFLEKVLEYRRRRS